MFRCLPELECNADT